MANYNLTQTGDEVQAYINSIPVIDVTGTLSGSTITFGSNPYSQIAANYAADCSSIVRLTVGTAVYLLRVTQYDGTNYTAVEMSGAHNVVATIGSSSASAIIDAGIDAAPTQGSNNLVKSGGVWSEVNEVVPIVPEIKSGWTVNWQGKLMTASLVYRFLTYTATKEMDVVVTFTNNHSYANNGKLFVLPSIDNLVVDYVATILNSFAQNVEGEYTAHLQSGNVLCVTYMSGDAYNFKTSKSVLEDIADLNDRLSQVVSTPINVGKNLLNRADCVVGVLRESGVDSSFTAYRTSGFIKVKPNTTYTINSERNRTYAVAEYSSTSGTGTLTTITTRPQSFTTASTTEYLRVCWNNNVQGILLEEGATATSFEGYTPLTLSTYEGRQLHGMEDIVIEKSKNILLTQYFTIHGYYNVSEFNSNESFRASNRLIPIKPNTTYICTAAPTYLSMYYYDVNKEPITIAVITTQTFTTPSGACYAIPSVAIGMLNNPVYMIYEGTEYPESFVPAEYGKATSLLSGEFSAHMIAEEEIVHRRNRMGGRKFVSLGDSITNRNQWQKIVDLYLGMTHTNYGVGGRKVANFCFDANAALIPSSELNNYDLIIVGGYANNSYAAGGKGTELGTIASEFMIISQESMDEYSSATAYMLALGSQDFYAQVKSTLVYLLTNAPSVPILCFGALQMSGNMMLPGDDTQTDTTVNFKKKNYYGLSNRDYSEAMKACCEYYSIPYVDLESFGGVNEINQGQYYSSSDHVHPNYVAYTGGYDYPDSGMRRMAIQIAHNIY